MITLTIVRHGESKDNLAAVWAGWKDAPLSNHGMNQAKALGKSFATTPVHHVFASPLKRALWTGQQVQMQNINQPPLVISPLMREQHFGDGHPFASSTEEGYFRLPGRTFKFPNGECLNDVRQRADQALAELIEPLLVETYGQSPEDKHVVLVAHGIFNSEFLGAMLARSPGGMDTPEMYRGMSNTGWTRVELGYADEVVGQPFPAGGPERRPLMVQTMGHWDVTTHLEGLKRQGGGIGSAAFDEKQQSIRDFFGGAQAAE